MAKKKSRSGKQVAKALKKTEVEEPKEPEIIIPEELKDIRAVSQQLFEAKVNELFFMTLPDLKSRVEDPKNESIIDLYLMKLITKGIANGDLKVFQWLVDKILEKPTARGVMVHKDWVAYIEEARNIKE